MTATATIDRRPRNERPHYYVRGWIHEFKTSYSTACMACGKPADDPIHDPATVRASIA